jgi:GNAT superfamily N-acetyltransferase
VEQYRIRPLEASTWNAFAALAQKHNGVWGGCWCTWFHRVPGEKKRGVPDEIWDSLEGAERTRAWKEHLVRQGDAHAALVFAGDDAIAWCQYGRVAELPNIYHRKEITTAQAADRNTAGPDYRITCFFVDRDHRRQGVAEVALQGALDLIGAAGGGVVESYPNDTQGRKESASFLHNATRTMFEKAGFSYLRPAGTKKCVMRLTVPAA